MADCMAKWAARQGGPPTELIALRARQRIRSEAVLRAAGAVLLQRLKARPRTQEDQSIKTRKRLEPAMPHRLRTAKKAKVVLVKEDSTGPTLVDLLHVGGRARCTAEHARQLVWQQGEPAAGLHHLAPAGPWPSAGSLQAKNGRVAWQWQCSRCLGRASDSSRALELVRKPCGGAHGVVLCKAPHEWEKSAEGPRCKRCCLVRSNGRGVETSGKFCPVPACAKRGLDWPEGEISLAIEIGKLHGFRRWCEPSAVVLRAPRAEDAVASVAEPPFWLRATARAPLADFSGPGACIWPASWVGVGFA